MRGHCHERGEKKANKYPEEKEIDIIWDILRKKGLMFLQTVKLPGEDPGSASSLYGRYRGAKTGSLVLV